MITIPHIGDALGTFFVSLFSLYIRPGTWDPNLSPVCAHHFADPTTTNPATHQNHELGVMPAPISEKRTSAVTLLKGTQDCIFDDSTPRYEPHLPFPPNPPSYDSDSDANHTHSFATTLRLRASIATTSEDRLREIMVKLVERNPGFQHAVAKELLPSATSNPPSPRRKRRRSRRSSDTAVPSHKCTNCGQRVKDDKSHVPTRHGGLDSECTYHPGKHCPCPRDACQSQNTPTDATWQVMCRTRSTNSCHGRPRGAASRWCARSRCGAAAMKTPGARDVSPRPRMCSPRIIARWSRIRRSPEYVRFRPIVFLDLADCWFQDVRHPSAGEILISITMGASMGC